VYSTENIDKDPNQYNYLNVSRNGKYILFVSTKNKAYNALVYYVDTKKYESETHSDKPGSNQPKGEDKINEEEKHEEDRNLAKQLVLSETQNIKCDFEAKADNAYYVYIPPENELKWRVTNHGDVIALSFIEEVFSINGNNIFNLLIQKIKNLILSEEKTKEGQYKIYKDQMTFGENYVVIRLKKSIVAFRFNTSDNTVHD